jgi:opacity protein-like surface antigen
MIRITVFFALLLLALPGYSQTERAVRFGLKAAPNLSWMNPDVTGVNPGGGRLKFTYGLMSDFFITDNYLFATGIEIMATGGALDFNPAVHYTTGTATNQQIYNLQRREYNIQYLNLPAILKMRTNEIGYMRYFGQFGFDVSFRTRARANDSGFYTAGRQESAENINIADDVQFIRLGLNLGAGIEYNLIGNTNLMVGISYSNGFTNGLRGVSTTLYPDRALPDEKLRQDAVINIVSLNVGVFF